MKYTVCILALASVAFGVTIQERNEFIKRQANTQDAVPVNVAAMTDANGNVKQFDSKGVYLDMQAKGL
ncbi:uncharacterized protein E0L32_002674 [Thyridium curvatum]|uniref:Uncharacterized protein n=1 Tax=Thyridium curvatum TaxID=1093900 RepID=A0A507B4V5_9PEZI|nr:uncharacterized protein E0L32_002674 [Thyridium curvatum]TPX18165.1 hypothetical protein E0L32_002674 [Thyridium curvatum]